VRQCMPKRRVEGSLGAVRMRACAAQSAGLAKGLAPSQPG
jgi:hypothetical protein